MLDASPRSPNAGVGRLKGLPHGAADLQQTSQPGADRAGDTPAVDT